MKPARRQTDSALVRLWNRLPKHRRFSLLSIGAMVVLFGLLMAYQRYLLLAPAPDPYLTEQEFVGPRLEEGAPALTADDPLTQNRAPAPKLLQLPITGVTERGYAPVWSAAMGDWRWHEGLDLRAPQGTAVQAAAPGVVLAVEERSLDGLTVEIDHQNGLTTSYSGLKEPLVAVGDTVAVGQAIAHVGPPGDAESGLPSHLHFAVAENGVAVDPWLFLQGSME